MTNHRELVFLTLLTSTLATIQLGKDTLSLTTSNFDDLMRKQSYTFVTMSEPFCTQCQDFDHEFKKLEHEFGNHSPPVSIGYIDLISNDELHERFDVRHLPTLCLFRGTKRIGTYQGPNEASIIAKWTYD